MARNNYFKVSSRESDLFQQLVREQIQIFGFDVHYIFRKFQNLDYLFGEDPVSKFNKSFQIEMFVSNYEFFEHQNKIIDKFGINLQDSLTLMVSKKRFTEESSKYGTDIAPNEGDIIYFPEYGGLYEIKYVQTRNSYFAYELSCELFRYSGENIDTKIKEVDVIEKNLMHPVKKFTLSGTGKTFYDGETIYQGNSLATSTYKATVLNFNGASGAVEVHSEVGSPSITTYLSGYSSGVTAFYTTYSGTDKVFSDSMNENTSTIELEKITKDIFDFTDKDPFSEGNY
jgi:hypothetical protein